MVLLTQISALIEMMQGSVGFIVVTPDDRLHILMGAQGQEQGTQVENTSQRQSEVHGYRQVKYMVTHNRKHNLDEKG